MVAHTGEPAQETRLPLQRLAAGSGDDTSECRFAPSHHAVASAVPIRSHTKLLHLSVQFEQWWKGSFTDTCSIAAIGTS